MNKTLKFILKLAVSAGFVAWIILRTNWSEVFFYIKQIKAWHIFAYAAAVVAGNVISANKWKILSEYKNIKRPLRDFFKFYLAGAFINNFMPSFIGGDTFRAYQVGRPEKRYKESASTVVIDRVTGFVGFTVLVIIFSLLNFKKIIQNPILVSIDVLVLFSFFVDIFLIKARKFAFWEKLHAWLPKKASDFIRELDHYNNNSKILVQATLWAMLFAAVGVGLANYILFWSLGVKVSVLDYLSVIFLISIISAVPISINNIGIKEWAYVTFFGFFGVSASIVVAIAIISRFLQMLISFLALPVYLESKAEEAFIAPE
jgi:uncharacterized protein (TIRG00374 family)